MIPLQMPFPLSLAVTIAMRIFWKSTGEENGLKEWQNLLRRSQRGSDGLQDWREMKEEEIVIDTLWNEIEKTLC